MIRRIAVPLDEPELAALAALARRSRRSIGRQAAYLLELAMVRELGEQPARKQAA